MTDYTFFRGRVALHAILKAIGITKGDEIATQAFTCMAVPEAILATGAHPIYVDIESRGFNMDAEDLELKITLNTRAIIVQHTYGIPANIDPIIRLAEQKGLPIIEDCCHTLHSMYKGKLVGTIGVGSFYSFEWGKPLVAGIGGGLRINDPLLSEKVRIAYTDYHLPDLFKQVKIELQYHAFSLLYRPFLYWPIKDLFHWLGDNNLAVSNYNPMGKEQVADDFHLLMAPAVQRRLAKKMSKIEDLTAHSLWVSDQYRQRIQSKSAFHLAIPEHCDTVFARYPLIAQNKSMLLSEARQAQVELAEWYTTPVHPLMGQDLEMFDYKIGACPNAEARCREIVTLPVHSSVRQRDIDRAVKFLNRADV